MTLRELIFFGSSLYKKYAAAPRLTQSEIVRCFREFSRTGAIPLGYRMDEGDKTVAWWLVYDETRFESDSRMFDALRAMSPPGIGLKIIRI